MQAKAVVVSQYLFAVALEWLFFKTSYNEIALKCKPSANYACAIPLIDGLGRSIVNPAAHVHRGFMSMATFCCTSYILYTYNREPASHVTTTFFMMTGAIQQMNYRTSHSNCATCFLVVIAVFPTLPQLIVPIWLPLELATTCRPWKRGLIM